MSVRRIGPPVWDGQNLSRFLEAHPDVLSGPYIEDGRAIVEVARKYTHAKDLLLKEISGLSLGKHISGEIKKGYKIYVDQELAQLKDEAFRIFLADYLEKRAKIC